MKTLWFGMFVALAGVTLAAVPARGQADFRPFELNVHAGSMHLDLTEDHQFMTGGRVSFRTRSGWGIGGNLDWVNTEFASVTMYSAEVNLNIDTGLPADFVLAAGIGAASVEPEDEVVDPPFEDTETDTLVPLGFGLRWHFDDTAPWVGYRVDIRDNIIFVEDDFDNDRHNWEFSGGVSLLF